MLLESEQQNTVKLGTALLLEKPPNPMENSVKLGNGRPNMEPNNKANPNMIQTAKLGKTRYSVITRKASKSDGKLGKTR